MTRRVRQGAGDAKLVPRATREKASSAGGYLDTSRARPGCAAGSTAAGVALDEGSGGSTAVPFVRMGASYDLDGLAGCHN